MSLCLVVVEECKSLLFKFVSDERITSSRNRVQRSSQIRALLCSLLSGTRTTHTWKWLTNTCYVAPNGEVRSIWRFLLMKITTQWRCQHDVNWVRSSYWQFINVKMRLRGIRWKYFVDSWTFRNQRFTAWALKVQTIAFLIQSENFHVYSLCSLKSLRYEYLSCLQQENKLIMKHERSAQGQPWVIKGASVGVDHKRSHTHMESVINVLWVSMMIARCNVTITNKWGGERRCVRALSCPWLSITFQYSRDSLWIWYWWKARWLSLHNASFTLWPAQKVSVTHFNHPGR